MTHDEEIETGKILSENVHINFQMLVRTRFAFWELVKDGISILYYLINILKTLYQFRNEIRKIASRLAVFLLNPRLLGVAILIPSMYFGLPMFNQIIAHPDIVLTGGSTFMQGLLLVIACMGLGAELLAAPSPRQRYL